MRTPLIEVRDVLGQNPAQVTFTEEECVIQALLPSRSHPSLGDRIGPRCSERGADLSDAKALEPTIEQLTIAAIAVVEQKPGRLTVPSATFYDLLRRPLGRWMLGYLNMQDFATGMADHEEDVERSEENRLHADEVASPNLASVLLEKVAPPGRWLSPMRPTHVLGDGSSRDFVPQPRQLRLDPPLAPQGILRGHTSDEQSELARDRVPATVSRRSGPPTPV
jgi:hypothetical protein